MFGNTASMCDSSDIGHRIMAKANTVTVRSHLQVLHVSKNQVSGTWPSVITLVSIIKVISSYLKKNFFSNFSNCVTQWGHNRIYKVLFRVGITSKYSK